MKVVCVWRPVVKKNILEFVENASWIVVTTLFLKRAEGYVKPRVRQ
jgi:hypothetical protein